MKFEEAILIPFAVFVLVYVFSAAVHRGKEFISEVVEERKNVDLFRKPNPHYDPPENKTPEA